MTRVVLLGASNVTLGFRPLTRLIRSGFQGPIDVRAALGHGRSYGVWCSMLCRGLPPIVRCGLWDDLLPDENVRTYALLTDVGNDLIYGSSPERIAGWVTTCLDRLAAIDARVVVTRLPVARVERLTSLRYHATRLAFFPSRRAVSWNEMLGRVRDLDARVADEAAARGAAVVTPPLDWYGLDPIHIRWTRRAAAWSQVLGSWAGFDAGTARPAAPLPLLGRMPQRYRLFGRDLSSPQPAAVLGDASLSLY